MALFLNVASRLRETASNEVTDQEKALFEAQRVRWEKCLSHRSLNIQPPSATVHPNGRFEVCLPEQKTLVYSGLLSENGDPLAIKTKARCVIQGQNCPDKRKGFVRTDARHKFIGQDSSFCPSQSGPFMDMSTTCVNWIGLAPCL